LKFPIGARAGNDQKQLYKDTIQKGIREILVKTNRQEADITRILASGMITSEFGLRELKHTTAPVGCEELHDVMEEVFLPEISVVPFVFMRGVRLRGETLETTDMMRGEETELMGIWEGEGIYILPGSHSKIIKTDASGRILDFKTMLTGEMAAALSQNTILKDAVDLAVSEIMPEYLMRGFAYCEKKGINEALFKVRILKNLFAKTPVECYSFFMGVLLCGEIHGILQEKPKKIIIGGKKQFREAIQILLKELSETEVVCLTEEQVEDSSALGMIKIYEKKERT